MPAFLLWLFEQIGLAALKRWLGGAPKVKDDHALVEKEAENLAKPSGNWDDITDHL